ncbi:MAG TPA: hypothetical protein VGH02_04815, partial [Rhizomicrobium sp.]
MADWAPIGSVDVGRGQDRDSAYTQFAGGLDRLQFIAVNGNAQCRFIRAQFANGRTQVVFQGTLQAGVGKIVQLPGDAAHVSRLDFNCRGDNARQTRVDIRADVTTAAYRDEWRRSPQWTRWSSVFHWGPPSPPPPSMSMDSGWRRVGVQSFGWTNERDGSVAGFAGQSVTSLGLRSDADARCPRIWVLFANGQRVNLATSSVLLQDGQMARFDLPGNSRNVTRVNMTCRAVSNHNVSVQVYTR